jgi:2-oxoglutarate ferredoxin oxidoreductase subunit gamma
MRGGTANCSVIVSDKPVGSPKVKRTDVKCFYVPATQMAKDMGAPGLANMILLGTLVRETGCMPDDKLEAGLRKVVPARKADMIDLNLKALQAGKDYRG